MSKENAWWQTMTFDFIKIPKDLFRMPQYSDLSTLAKLLYGFLLVVPKRTPGYAGGRKKL